MSPDSAGAPRIALVSPCGWGNLGDAAILDTVIGAIRERWPEADVFALTLNPTDTETRHQIPAAPLAAFSRPGYPVAGQDPAGGFRSSLRAAGREFAARKREGDLLDGCRLVVVAGGGQLDDFWGGAWGHPYVLRKWARRARRRGIPVAIVGTGFGTCRTALSKRFLRSALRLASTCSLRDEGSLQLAHALDARVPLRLCPDLAFATPTPPRSRRATGQPMRIGISPMAFADPRVWPEPERDAALYSGYVGRLGELIGLCARAGHEVHLFSTDGPDRVTVREVADHVPADVRAGRVVAHDTTGVPAALAVVAQLDAVVASRLHGVILSMVATCPVVALSYERKVDRVMLDFGQEQFTHPIATFDPQAVLNSLASLLMDARRTEQRLQRKLTECRARVCSEFSRVLALVGRAE